MTPIFADAFYCRRDSEFCWDSRARKPVSSRYRVSCAVAAACQGALTYLHRGLVPLFSSGW